MVGSKESIAGRGVTKGPGSREGSELVIIFGATDGFTMVAGTRGALGGP